MRRTVECIVSILDIMRPSLTAIAVVCAVVSVLGAAFLRPGILGAVVVTGCVSAVLSAVSGR